MDAHVQPDSNLACPAEADPSVCGISKYRALTTWAITTGFGGSINFCTPDTNAVQLYRGYSYEYTLQDKTKNKWAVTDQEWTHKIAFAGQTFFHIDLTRYSGPSGVVWEPLVRITVPGEFPVAGDSDAITESVDVNAEPGRQELVEKFITDKVVPWLGKAVTKL